MSIIYKQDINIENIYNVYDGVLSKCKTFEEKTNLIILMKKINNVHKSIKLRICELIRTTNLICPFFEENRTFVLNTINEDYPHFIFTKHGITALKLIEDEKLTNYVESYLKLLQLINTTFKDKIRNDITL